MSASHIEELRQYLYRQYEIEEGSVEENVYGLFAEDAVIREGEGKVLSTKDLIRAATSVRSTPKGERLVEFSDASEQGDIATFHMRVRFRNPETGELNETETDYWVRFNGQGRVVETKSTRTDDGAALYRSAGAAQE
jgi:hypothetical protein